MDEIQQAVRLLQSLGFQNLCHDDFLEFVPSCYDETSSSSSSIISSNLRGSLDVGRQRFLEPHKHFDNIVQQESYYAFNIIGAIICVSSVALIAGLFLGLLTLDILQLRIILRSSNDEDEKMYARTIMPIVEQRHLLLVTLLLMNTVFYETLPIFLDALLPSWAAILLSTTLIMFFGEILPSGIFMGPQQLYLGYKLSPLVNVFLWIMYPVAKPLALCLDYLVKGEGDTVDGTDEGYSRGELSALVRIQFEDSKLHRSHGTKTNPIDDQRLDKEDSWQAMKQEIFEKANDGNDNDDQDPDQQLHPPLHPTEVDLIEGALQMKTMLVMDVYTPLRHVYSVPDDMVLDRQGFTGIYHEGYSRVPVYRENPQNPDDKTSILGFLIVRQLMLIDWDHEREISTLPLQQPICISPRTNLVEALRILRSKGYLMTFVCARPDLANKAFEAGKAIPVEAGFMGLVTLQDIMESLLQKRIYDEWDMKARDRAVATLQRWAATKLQDFIRRKRKNIPDTALTANGESESVPLLGSANRQNGHLQYRSLLDKIHDSSPSH